MLIIQPELIPEQWGTRIDIDGEQGTRHLISRALTGTEELVADLARFPPGFVHHLHRHFEADQLMMPLDGPLVALHPNGDREIAAGEVALFPRNEWHGARNDGDAAVLALILFSGVGELADAGYEESAGKL